MIDEIDLKVEKHMAIWSERHLAIELQFRSVNARLKKIETILWTSAIVLITGMASIIVLLLQMRISA